jgi:Fe-S-cluster-containing dehydrogenase component
MAMLTTASRGLLIDLTKCVGCGECVSACLTAHDLPGDASSVTGLSATALTALTETNGIYVRQLCRHCVTPSCVSVCPVEAFRKTPEGPVVLEILYLTDEFRNVFGKCCARGHFDQRNPPVDG